MTRPAGERRYSALVIGGAALALILTFLLANASRPPLIENVGAPPVLVSMEPLEPEAPTLEPMPTIEPELLPTGVDLPNWLPEAITALVVAVVLGLVAWFIIRLLQARVIANRATAAEPSGEGVEIEDLDEEQLAETVEEAMRSLRHGVAVEGAVVECWRRLEQLAADTGIRRRAAQTSQEFTVEVLSRTDADPQHLGRLGDLYRQAVFSTHTLTDDDRERAIASLESLSSQLRGAT